MAGLLSETSPDRNFFARRCVSGCRLRFLPTLGIALLAGALLIGAAPAYAARRCYSPAYAVRHPRQKLCVKAHVYQEIPLSDGTLILDTCSPRRRSADCRFAFVSLGGQRSAVGDLKQYVGKEVEVRGEVRPIHDRAEILLSRAKQIHAVEQSEYSGKEEAKAGRRHFHPNPALLKGFNATESRMPIAAPAFRSRDGN